VVRKKNSGGCNFYFFLAFVGKNDPHIGVLAGFLRSGGGKVWGKSNLDLKAFDGHWARGKSAVFWHLGRLLGVFSTRNETGGFTGFSDIGNYTWTGKGVHFGRIFPDYSIPSKHYFLKNISYFRRALYRR
jgi:hypothetical protein